MARVNPTESRDGLSRVDVRISFRLSRADMISVLVNNRVTFGEVEDLPATKVMYVIKERLRQAGEASLYTDYAQDEDFVWAEAQIEKIWPKG